MARLIGIHHRAKKEKGQDEGSKATRGTSVVIKNLETGKVAQVTLRSETDELDFLLGRFPTSWREVSEAEDVSSFFPRHIQRRKKGEGFVTRIPESYEGFQVADTVVMQMGGSGDRFAYALSRRGEKIGAKLFRIPPNVFATWREGKGTEKDHILLIELFEAFPEIFYEVTPRERKYIRVAAAFHSYLFAQRDRISCQLRIYQQHSGEIFLSEEGHYPEGKLEEEYDAVLIDDPGYAAFVAREKRAEAKMRAAVRDTEVWGAIFSQIPGMGERIAAGIIGPVGNVLRFVEKPNLAGVTDPEETRKRRRIAKRKSMNNFVKFCGVHVTSDGELPRRKRGAGKDNQYGDNPRQSLVLLSKEFVYQAGSYWGQRLRATKARVRERHPEVEVIDGRKRYTDGDTAGMAGWRVLTRFAEKLFRHYATFEKARIKEAQAVK